MSEPAVETAVSRRTFTHRGNDVLSLTVRRPVCQTLPVFTKFYEACAKKIEKRCAVIASHVKCIDGQPPQGVSVRHRVTLCTKRYLSVLLEVSFFDGVKTRVNGYAQIWDVTDGRLLSPADLFTDTLRARHRLLPAVLAAVRDAADAGSVSEPSVGIAALARAFHLENACLTPRGIAFFFPGGAFQDEKNGTPLFVLPAEQLRGWLKISF